jgi:energy-coupling factor transport system ATP-binding protein
VKITIEQVSYAYPNGVKALAGINLEIAAGQQVAWIGANGAGKSTLARHLNGLLLPQTGRVLLDQLDTRGQDAADLSRLVGYVFQNPDEQLFSRTVWEEVAFGPRNLGQPVEAVETSVEAALTAVDLAAEAQRHPYDLPRFRRQDLGLASILAMDPQVLILDEPTTGQDRHGTDRLSRVLDEWRARGRTLILISHDMDFCAEHADRAVVFSAGRLVLDGRAQDVFGRAEVLGSASLDPPQLVRLARALGWSETPLGVEPFLEAWAARRRPGGTR